MKSVSKNRLLQINIARTQRQVFSPNSIGGKFTFENLRLEYARVHFQSQVFILKYNNGHRTEKNTQFNGDTLQSRTSWHTREKWDFG